MRIGIVAERLGMPASTIRYYEQIGLIDPPQRVAGKRDFDEQILLVLQFVQLAQSAGFSIDEIKALMARFAEDPSPSGMWKPFAEAKQASVRQQIKDLKQVDRILTTILSCKCATLTQCVRESVSGRNPQ